jgi:hypothetical protein
MKKGTIMRKSIGVVAALVLAAGVVGATGTPAMASSSSCTISGYNCTTGTLAANSSGHYVRVFAWANFLQPSTTCTVYDASNGVDVGSVTGGYNNKEKKINGLYGRYFAVCVGKDLQGGGSLSN